jgi:hypothetical protein
MLPRTHGIRSAHTNDGGVVLDIKSGRMFSLNHSASFIFRLLERGLTDLQIAEQLAELFAISTEEARNDVAEFREALNRHSILPTTD